MKLYLVTDEEILKGKDLYTVVEAAVRGGVSMVQLREKTTSTREFIEHAKALKKLLKNYNVPLIINDRVDVALAADADGVHIGQSDMYYHDLKKLLPKGKIIGLSVETEEQVIEANNFDVDYIAASPVWSTPTKTNTIVEWGLEGVKKLCQLSKHPVIGIGGIKIENARSVFEAGASGIAVVSGIIAANDPEEAARGFLRTIKN